LSGLLFLAFGGCSRKQDDKAKQEGTTPVMSSDAELQRLTKLISQEPGNPDYLFQRASAFLSRKKFQNALNDITLAVGIDSMRKDFFMVKAEAHFGLVQVPQAIEAFQKVLQLDPSSVDANLKLAELHLYLREYQQCLTYLNNTLKIDKNKAKAYFIKGFVYKETGDTARAISSFQTCTEIEPQNYDAFIQLGILYAKQGNKLALQYYDNAIKLKPQSTEAYYNRGLFLQETGEYNKSVEDYYTILKIDPNYKDAHFNLGYIHLAYLKVYRQAIKHFSDAIACDKDYIEAYYNRAISYENLGDVSSAAKDYRQALSIYPQYKLAQEGLKRVEN
jgi:tetratricopeptide (TPR) repeat protein